MNTPNIFTEPVVRSAILTLSNGEKMRVKAKIYPKPRYFQAEYERDLVEEFNRSQPNMVHKAVKCHLMRN